MARKRRHPSGKCAAGGLRGSFAAWLALSICLVLLGPSSCSDREAQTETEDLDQMLLGRVGDYEFTVGDLKNKLAYQYGSRLPERGPAGVQQHRELVDVALDELCWVMLGEERGYDETPVVRDTYELSRRFILARETVNQEVTQKAEPTQEEIEEYHREHQSDYQMPTRVEIAHVQVRTEAEAERVRDRLRSGEKIEDVAREVSIDEMSKNDGGYLCWITSKSGAAHLGFVTPINEAAMKLRKGDVSEPVRIPADGTWTVLYALDRTEVGPRSLDDALREVIAEKVANRKQAERRERLLTDLKNEYDYEFYPEAYERYAMTLVTDEELFAMAQREKLAENKIKQYERILEHHPQSAYVPQARFMIAFIRANEMGEFATAREEFEAFLAQYPDHELAESARWMMQNLETADQDPARLNEVQRRAQSGR